MTPPIVRRYILTYPKGRHTVITIPDGARITFGPAIPFNKKMGGGGEYVTAERGTYAIRVYEGATDKSLIGVFTGVCEVRCDDLIKILPGEQATGRFIEDDDENEKLQLNPAPRVWSDTLRRLERSLIGVATADAPAGGTVDVVIGSSEA